MLILMNKFITDRWSPHTLHDAFMTWGNMLNTSHSVNHLFTSYYKPIWLKSTLNQTIPLLWVNAGFQQRNQKGIFIE